MTWHEGAFEELIDVCVEGFAGATDTDGDGLYEHLTLRCARPLNLFDAQAPRAVKQNSLQARPTMSET